MRLPFGIANMMAGSNAFVVGPVARMRCPIILKVQELSQKFERGGDFTRYLGVLSIPLLPPCRARMTET